jgi:uncharacterized protein YkwD
MVLLALIPAHAQLATITSSRLIELTNASRRQNGLSPLKVSARLSRSAALKAQDMLKRDYFSHYTPEGKPPWSFFEKAGYRYVYAGENLAIDFSSAEEMHRAWMSSTTHRANILHPQYTEIGIAVVSGEFQGRTTTIAVQHFGTPLLVPTPTPSPLTQTAARALPPKPTPPPAPPPDRTPPPPPLLTFPLPAALLTGKTITVKGKAEKEAKVIILLNQKRTAETKADAQGNFRTQIPLPPHTEKRVVLTALAIDGAGNRSRPSAPLNIRIDTTPPALPTESVVLLPPPHPSSDKLILAFPVPELPSQAEVVMLGGSIQLQLDSRLHLAYAKIPRLSRTAQVLTLRLRDAAGNENRQTITPSFIAFTDNLDQAPPVKMHTRFLRLVNWGQKITLGTLLVITALAIANILIYLRRQHPALILNSLISISLMAGLLFF